MNAKKEIVSLLVYTIEIVMVVVLVINVCTCQSVCLLCQHRQSVQLPVPLVRTDHRARTALG